MILMSISQLKLKGQLNHKLMNIFAVAYRLLAICFCYYPRTGNIQHAYYSCPRSSFYFFTVFIANKNFALDTILLDCLKKMKVSLTSTIAYELLSPLH